MAEFALIVIGASAGGIEALINVVGGLPPNLPAAICVVVHFPPTSASKLPRILTRADGYHAQHASDGQRIEPGCIYVAPPDRHLLVSRDRLTLGRGPKYNGTRPAIDPLFRTAARAYGPRCIGVLLSGALDDGVAGLAAIKSHGGLAVVQDPAEALFDSMPRIALESVAVDQVLPAAGLGPALARLAAQRAGEPMPEIGMQGVAEDEEDEFGST